MEYRLFRKLEFFRSPAKIVKKNFFSIFSENFFSEISNFKQFFFLEFFMSSKNFFFWNFLIQAEKWKICCFNISENFPKSDDSHLLQAL